MPAGAATPGWTLETLHVHLLKIMDERDRRYQERFVAQEQALRLALDSVNKEFHEHVKQVREETKAALAAADKAIVKSEEANQRRFESVNEFRAQLSDQAATFLPRQEYDRSLGGLSRRLEDLHAMMLEKVDGVLKTVNAQIESLETRLSGVEVMVK